MKKLFFLLILSIAIQSSFCQINSPDKDLNFTQKIVVSLFPNKTAKAIKKAIKKSDFSTAKSLIEKATKKHKSEVTEMAVCYNIVLALFYENYNLPDSACRYYKNAKQAFFFATPKDLYILKKHELNGKTIDNKWINAQADKEICKLFCDRALYLLLKGKCDKKSVIEEFIQSSTAKNEFNVAPQSYYIAQGLYYELCENEKRTACDNYKTAYSKKKSDKDNEILQIHKITKKWLERKNEFCVFYSDRIIEKLQIFNCSSAVEIETLLKQANSENENVLIPKAFSIANALYYEYCKNQRQEACRYYKDANLKLSTNYDVEILKKYPSLSDDWLNNKAENCVRDKKKMGEIKVDQIKLSADIKLYEKKHKEIEKLIQDTISYFQNHGGLPKTEFKVTRIGKNGETVEFLLTTEFDNSKTTIFETYEEDYKPGSYKTNTIDKLMNMFSVLVMQDISENLCESTSASINILGTADGMPIGKNIVYSGDIENKTNIQDSYYVINQHDAISDKFYNNKLVKRPFVSS